MSEAVFNFFLAVSTGKCPDNCDSYELGGCFVRQDSQTELSLEFFRNCCGIDLLRPTEELSGILHLFNSG